MPRSRPPYPPEFREQIVDLHRAGRSFTELTAEFEPSEQTIRAWVASAQAAAPSISGALPADEREELKRLRRENRQLRLEREILSKAAAWFARESNTLPGGGNSTLS